MTTRGLVRRFVLLRALRWLPLGVGLPFLVLLPLDRGLGLGEVGVMWATHSVVAIVLEVPSGGLADTIGRRATLVAGGLLTAAGLAGIALATGLLAFMLAAGVIAAGRALISGSLEAWFVDEARTIDPDLALHRPLSHANTAEGLATGLGAAVGGLLPLLAGGLPARGDDLLVELSIPLLAGSFAALVYVAAVLRYVHEPRRVRGASWRDAGATTLAGLRTARRSPSLRLLLFAGTAIGVVMSTTELLWQPHLEELLSGDASDSAPLFGALAAASMVAFSAGAALSPPANRAFGRARAYPGAYVGLACTLGALAVVDSVALFCAVYLLYFCALGLGEPLREEALQDAIDGPNRATVTSAEGLMSQVGGIGGNLVLTPLAGVVGIGIAWGATAAVALVAASLSAATVALGAARPRPRPAAPSGAA